MFFYLDPDPYWGKTWIRIRIKLISSTLLYTFQYLYIFVTFFFRSVWATVATEPAADWEGLLFQPGRQWGGVWLVWRAIASPLPTRWSGHVFVIIHFVYLSAVSLSLYLSCQLAFSPPLQRRGRIKINLYLPSYLLFYINFLVMLRVCSDIFEANFKLKRGRLHTDAL